MAERKFFGGGKNPPLDRGNEGSEQSSLKNGFEFHIGLILQYLIASGHSLTNIFIDKQENLPYQGWSFPQYRYWSKIIVHYRNTSKASMIGDISEALDGHSSKGNRRKLIERLEELNGK